MPKWLGTIVHYLTFKKVFTSQEGWVFAWRRGGEWELFSPFPTSFPRYRIIGEDRIRTDDYLFPRWGGRLWLKDD